MDFLGYFNETYFYHGTPVELKGDLFLKGTYYTTKLDMAIKFGFKWGFDDLDFSLGDPLLQDVPFVFLSPNNVPEDSLIYVYYTKDKNNMKSTETNTGTYFPDIYRSTKELKYKLYKVFPSWKKEIKWSVKNA